jgi:hypothetical protein
MERQERWKLKRNKERKAKKQAIFLLPASDGNDYLVTHSSVLLASFILFSLGSANRAF